MLFVAGVYSLLSIAGSACDNDVSDAGKDAIFEIDDAFLFVCLFVCFPVKKNVCDAVVAVALLFCGVW